MRTITTSELRCYQACPREHHYRYRLGYRAEREAGTLRFGHMVHTALAAWLTSPADRLLAAATAMHGDGKTELDRFDLARAEALMMGYQARWESEGLEVLAVESEFQCPIINPDTGHRTPLFELAGKTDAIVRADGRVLIMEHKTSSEDIGPGSGYWKRLTLDSQVSLYYLGAKACGYDVEGCLYDVLRKPAQRPGLATPEAERQYTKKDGKLYASQRACDELPSEYHARIVDAIAEDPSRYYQRGVVVRTEADERDAAYDLWQLCRLLRESELAERYPRNVASCVRYSRTCDFFPVCCHEADLNDTTQYRKADRTHEELAA